MKPRTLLSVLALESLPVATLAADKPQKPASPAQAALARLTALAGEWEGTSPMRLAGEIQGDCAGRGLAIRPFPVAKATDRTVPGATFH